MTTTLTLNFQSWVVLTNEISNSFFANKILTFFYVFYDFFNILNYNKFGNIGIQIVFKFW